jgi:tRNA A64-2'-O-ribosylphosphate transferase
VAGKFRNFGARPRINKDFIKQRLSWIMTSYPTVSPSRTTLQSINDFLLTNPDESDGPIIMAKARLPKSQKPKDSSTLIFRALEGAWTLERTITNFHTEGIAGTVKGTVMFNAREPTSELGQSEYLYQEQGIFKTEQGNQMSVNRNWIWRLIKPTTTTDTSTPTIHIYFAKPDGVTEDYEYNSLGVPREEKLSGFEDITLSIARAEHPCGRDFYESTYSFYLAHGEMARFEVMHKVKGPAKDYVSRSLHTRGK